MVFKKKLIIGIVVAVVVIGCIGGAVIASTGSDITTATTVPTEPQDTLMEKVAAKLNISVDTLQTAFQEAQSEMQQERLDAQLAKLVEEGKITQEQADAYKNWLNTRPDDTEFRTALQAWQDSNPLSGVDVPLPGMGRLGGFGGRIGMSDGFKQFGCR